jgi:WD40 repeat protein
VASDGRIAAGSADKKLRFFAADSTKPTETHPGDGMAVKALAWGRDGKLASGGNDASVKLWGTEAKKPLHVIQFAGSVESLAFAPNGKMLAAGASEDHVRIWSYPGRKLLHELTSAGSPPAVSALAWSPDSASLLAGRANHTAQVWDVKSGKTRHSLAVMAPVHAVAWAAGGTTAVTCTIDRSVRFWSAANGQIQTTLVADGEQLAAVSAEGHYRVPNEKETELVFVVLTKTGMDTLTPAAFAEKYAWKNNPALARVPLK